MGQAAALSGGYGNSYAQTAGQQAYNASLQNLNNVIPELQSAAMQAYENEGTEKSSELATLQGVDESEYSKYRDEMSDWQTELSYLYNKTNDMSEEEYNRYLNDRSAWEADREYWANKTQTEQEQENWADAVGIIRWRRTLRRKSRAAAGAAAGAEAEVEGAMG